MSDNRWAKKVTKWKDETEVDHGHNGEMISRKWQGLSGWRISRDVTYKALEFMMMMLYFFIAIKSSFP